MKLFDRIIRSKFFSVFGAGLMILTGSYLVINLWFMIHESIVQSDRCVANTAMYAYDSIRYAIFIYHLDHDKFPDSLTELVDEKYLRCIPNSVAANKLEFAPESGGNLRISYRPGRDTKRFFFSVYYGGISGEHLFQHNNRYNDYFFFAISRLRRYGSVESITYSSINEGICWCGIVFRDVNTKESDFTSLKKQIAPATEEIKSHFSSEAKIRFDYYWGNHKNILFSSKLLDPDETNDKHNGQ